MMEMGNAWPPPKAVSRTGNPWRNCGNHRDFAMLTKSTGFCLEVRLCRGVFVRNWQALLSAMISPRWKARSRLCSRLSARVVDPQAYQLLGACEIPSDASGPLPIQPAAVTACGAKMRPSIPLTLTEIRHGGLRASPRAQAGATGKLIVNVLPTPGSDSTRKVPECRLAKP